MGGGGGFLSSIAPIAIGAGLGGLLGPTALIGAGLGPSLLTGAALGATVGTANQAEKKQKSAQEDALAAWQANAFPSQANVQANLNSNLAKLSSDRTNAYTSMMRDLSTRGAGPGSGMIGAGAGKIEKGYLQNLGNAYNQSTIYANTPRFAPQRYEAYPSPDYTSGLAPLMTAITYQQRLKDFKNAFPNAYGANGQSTSMPTDMGYYGMGGGNWYDYQ